MRVRWDLTRSTRTPNLKFLASHIPKIPRTFDAKAGCARECAQTNAWISVVFYPTPTKSGVDTVEWSMLYANVLEFRFVFAFQNYSANCLRLPTKNGTNYGFFSPICFMGHARAGDHNYNAYNTVWFQCSLFAIHIQVMRLD